MNDRMMELVEITRMGLDVELAKLRDIQKSISKLHGKINNLRDQENDRRRKLAAYGQADLALFSGADEKWLKWQKIQIAKYNTRLAALMAEKNIQTASAKIAFGKNHAIQAVIEKAG